MDGTSKAVQQNRHTCHTKEKAQFNSIIRQLLWGKRCSSLNPPTGLCSIAPAGCRLNSALLLFWPQDYDDGYGTAYDDQGYESYDNSYNNQGQK